MKEAKFVTYLFSPLESLYLPNVKELLEKMNLKFEEPKDKDGKRIVIILPDIYTVQDVFELGALIGMVIASANNKDSKQSI